ncbi:MAG: stress response translation initiation inhibitor YciH [Gammaproteobacteria bacterium]|nr:MAG: stress response translation initiation inhibitor YciH [Gammaproteobacteria bacterium]
MSKETRLVYSTESGRVKTTEPAPQRPAGDGIVRIRRETSGRKGKGVTTISGLDLPDTALKLVAKHLKQLCGTGGSVKDGVIEIQGDHRETIRESLSQQGYTVKLAGG